MKNNSFWKFIDSFGTFIAKDPHNISYLYFPLANEARMMSSITPDLKGDIKTSNNSFLTLPTSRPDLPDTNSSRNFWLYLNKSKKTWSLTGCHPNNNQDKVIVQSGLLFHKTIRKNSKLGIETEVVNFVPTTKDQAELMLIKVTNISKSISEITPTSAIPIFARSADNLRDHRHVTSLLNRIKQEKYGVVVKPVMSFDERGHKVNQTSYYIFGIDSNNKPPIGSFATIDSFIQEGGSLGNPQTVEKNSSPIKLSQQELAGKEAIGALRFETKKLKPKESTCFALILGIAETQKDIQSTFKKFNTINKINTALNENKFYWKNKLNSLCFNTGDYEYDNWLRWVSLQPTLRKIFGCSFLPDFDYGRGGKGWRDLWQDCLTLLLINPEDIRKLISSNFSGVRIDATNATIITKKPGQFIADRNRISRVWSDHGIWPLFTLDLYINQTGDLNILLEKTSYFRDPQIMRSKELDYNWDGSHNLRTKQNKIYKGSILEHVLIQHLVQFFNVGTHNNIRLENADWNDGLDMAPDRGETVAFSSFYAYNLNKIADLLEKLKTINKIKDVSLLKEVLLLLKPINYNSVQSKIKVLNKYLNSTKLNVSGKTTRVKINQLVKNLRGKASWLLKHINKKEWISIGNLGLFNGYYDNKSRRVEGRQKGLVKMTLTGQVFPILSRAATDKQVKKIYQAAKKYLQDKKTKGFRLNTNFKKPQFDLGRAFAFAYGEKENGAIFSHMCVMFAFSLYSRGFAKEGFEVLNSLYQLAKNSCVSKIYPNLPEYFNLQGRGMYSYLTGSASWYVMTLLTQVFGIRGELGNLIIAPKLVRQQFKTSKQISVALNFANKKINITFLNPNKKDFPNYSIREVRTNLSSQRISPKEILIKKTSILSSKSKQINIKIILD